MAVKVAMILTPLILVYLGFYIMSPVQKIDDFYKFANPGEETGFARDTTMYSSEQVRLIHRKASLEALLKMSESDSIQLFINLTDSIVSLTIKGVIIHTVNVSSIKIDPLLDKLPVTLYTGLFSEPIPVLSQFATTVKEPIVVREAPKDTLEAAQNAYLPDTLVQRPAFMEVKLAHGIRIIMEQQDNPRFRDRWVRRSFRIKVAGKEAGEHIVNLVRFRKPEYHPVIRLKLPTDDLRTIYRALPGDPQLVLYF